MWCSTESGDPTPLPMGIKRENVLGDERETRGVNVEFSIILFVC